MEGTVRVQVCRMELDCGAVETNYGLGVGMRRGCDVKGG